MSSNFHGIQPDTNSRHNSSFPSIIACSSKVTPGKTNGMMSVYPVIMMTANAPGSNELPRKKYLHFSTHFAVNQTDHVHPPALVG